MALPTLLVICPPEHYALRNLKAIAGEARILVGNTVEFAAEHGPAADVLLYSGLGGYTVPFAQVWPYATRVQWVHSLSAGVEKYLLPEFLASPVPLTNARGVFKRSLAEFAVLGVLYFSKKVRRLVESQRARVWDDFKVDWVSGKTMGVVGYGEIGRECASLGHALGMRIVALRRNTARSAEDPLLDAVFGPGQLSELLRESDVVVAAAPLTPATHHLLGEEQFRAMKKSAIVINVGRGPVIDEAALVQALEDGSIAGAALDVFETEPLPADSPLWGMENVLLSPHCTDRTQDPDWLDLTMQFFLTNFERFRKGMPLENIVDKQAGY